MSAYQVRATWPEKGSVMCLGIEAASETDAIGRASLLVPSLMRGAQIEVERIPPPPFRGSSGHHSP